MLRTAAMFVSLMTLEDVCQGKEQSHGLYKLDLQTVAGLYGRVLRNPQLLNAARSESASESLINLISGSSDHPRV